MPSPVIYSMLFQFPVFLIRNRLKPLIGRSFSRHFEGKMLEPGIRSRAVPVFYFRRDVYNISGFQLLCLFAPFLIIAPSACYKEDLTAFVMDMPVIAAARLESHVADAYSFCSEHFQIALSDEVLRECCVRLADLKYISTA